MSDDPNLNVDHDEHLKTKREDKTRFEFSIENMQQAADFNRQQLQKQETMIRLATEEALRLRTKLTEIERELGWLMELNLIELNDG